MCARMSDTVCETVCTMYGGVCVCARMSDTVCETMCMMYGGVCVRVRDTVCETMCMMWVCGAVSQYAFQHTVKLIFNHQTITEAGTHGCRHAPTNNFFQNVCFWNQM